MWEEGGEDGALSGCGGVRVVAEGVHGDGLRERGWMGWVYGSVVLLGDYVGEEDSERCSDFKFLIGWVVSERV